MSGIKMSWISKVSIIAFAFFLLNVQFSYSAENEEEVRTAAEQFYASLNSLFKGELDPMIELGRTQMTLLIWALTVEY